MPLGILNMLMYLVGGGVRIDLDDLVLGICDSVLLPVGDDSVICVAVGHDAVLPTTVETDALSLIHI